MRNSTGFAAVHFGPSLPGLWGRNHYIGTCFHHPDDGGGNDAAGGGDEGIGGDGNDVGDDTGAGGGGGGIQAHEFKDLTGHVRLPGFKDPVALKDVASALGSRTQYEGTIKVVGQLAKALQQQQQGQGQGGRQPQGQGGRQPQRQTAGQKEQVDALAQLESMELLDGKTVAGLLREIQTNTLNPMAQAILALGQQLKETRGHVSGFRQRDTESEISGEFKNVISSLKLPTVGGKGVEGADVINEMIRDFFFSFADEDHPHLKGEKLATLFGERFKAVRTMFRNLEKHELAAAQERQRNMRFPRQGAVSGNGKRKKMMTNQELANAMFAGSAAET